MEQVLLAVIGLSAGIVVAGGIFALTVGLKIIPRFVQFTHTAHRTMLYESCIVWGGILGNVLYIYQTPVAAGFAGLLLFGFAAGIYVGAWAMALAEIVDTIPIFSRRVGMKRGFSKIILMMALGRTLGGLAHFYFRW